MKLTRILLCSAFALSCVAGLAQSAAKQIEKEYAMVRKHMQARDAKGLEKLFLSGSTKDFVFVGPKKETANRAQFLAQMKASFPMITSMKIPVMKAHVVKLHGKIAIVKTTMRTVMTLKGMSKPMDVTDYTTDTWRLEGKIWKLAKVVTVKETTGKGMAAAAAN